ncbi:MAG TPA: M1 family metallopeptidase [Holophagaceae bacterium]|nr:M1 family metallopeptidase [Holophagaceae bacterium]
MRTFALLAALALPAMAQTPLPEALLRPGADVHTAAHLGGPTVRHLDLDLNVDFAAHRLGGTATWTLKAAPKAATTLNLDGRDLEIQAVATSRDAKAWRPAPFKVVPVSKALGQRIEVKVPKGHGLVRLTYRTSDHAGGLQWLEPAQTAGKRHPFLFTQAQAIQARSFVPCQDGPSVRLTFTARFHTPKELRALMAADFDRAAPRNGDYRFRLDQPVPSYLLAFAVGDLDFQPLGPRTGVWAEPSMLAKSAQELEDTEAMVKATEALYGPYAWGRYDLLMLPPSFPFGGMENPKLTFATPTILAGDKSLVSLVAHELAHSWSGNLVTNATWRDFWLNEGFTTYVERRILEAVYGRKLAEMEAVLGAQDLKEDLAHVDPAFRPLLPAMGEHDPDDAYSRIPYEKGALLLRRLEEAYGRPAFDAWLRSWFQDHALQSVHTSEFLAHVRKHLLSQAPDKAPDLAAWLTEGTYPADAPRPESPAFAAVEAQARRWSQGEGQPPKPGRPAGYDMDSPKRLIDPTGWTTQEWLHFLRVLPRLQQTPMAALDRAFHLTDTGNAEIAHQWLLMCIRAGYEPAWPRLERYLVEIGRRKLIVPLYQELLTTPEGTARAKAIYAAARPGYHPIAQATLDTLLRGK